MQKAVRPLQRTANSWAARHLTRLQEAPAGLIRELQALLNKLIWSNIDSICERLVAKLVSLEDANEDEILRKLIVMMLEQVTDQGPWSEMYAKLCHKLHLELTDRWHGGRWFPYYIACTWHQRFEWQAHHLSPEMGATNKDDDYHAALRIRRRLGLTRFHAELYKLNFLKDCHLHHHIKSLLQNHTEIQENLVYLRYLLINCGKLLDQPKAQSFMNLYFDTLIRVSQSPLVCSRTRFMIQDILDARRNGWNRRKVGGDNSLDVDRPARSAAPDAQSHHDLDPSSTHKSCQTEFDASSNDKRKLLESADENFVSTGTPIHILADDQQKALLETVLYQQRLELQAVNGNISSQGWTNVTDQMKRKFGQDFQPRGLRNHLCRIHETYLDLKFLQNRFGFIWDEKNCIITAAPKAWDQLIKENPEKKYHWLRNPRSMIGWYCLAQQVFNGVPVRNRGTLVFFNNNVNKREDSQNDAANSTIASGSADPTIPLISKRKNEAIASDNHSDLSHVDPLSSSASRVIKQPRLSNLTPTAKENGDRSSETVPANASENTTQPTPVIQSEDSLRDPPIEAATSMMLCATERNNEPTSSSFVDNDVCMAPSSSTPRAQHNPVEHSERAEREEKAVVNDVAESETKLNDEDHQKSTNPTIQAISLMAPMLVDQVSPLEFVKFVQVVENHTNAQIFLSLVSSTNPIICKIWLQQKSL
ncbi:hypothetical protein PTTG_05293 [Puccinia triticina 1-1 BBBD Race 1]|uniref:MIF4G domain-containing protein n=1 Tax=Puccinia triticina (isolate 1-1 / race 1 (BBBD)) TaxID=630390 RepID=A0A180H1G1_PUCT1|nr:hypothetical protein PTTG_05293 [Puccinia triticina 1-1 BBBD Race 1]WAR58442.1 hypothetical protein PtB15_5B676 [Puccinia triticina]